MKKILGILLICSLTIAEGKISGVGFYNYTYNLTEGAFGANKSSFALDRVYFTYKNSISDNISFKFQTDVGNVGDDSRLTSYLKKAQLDWKGPCNIILGMQGMNMFNITEKNWGFRFIEKSPMDKHKFSSSADMGIGFSGKMSRFNYSILITNGSGYKKQESDAYKKTSVQLVYGQKRLFKELKDGFNIGASFSHEPYNSNDTKTVMSFFGGFASALGAGLSFGAEFDMYRDSGEDKTKEIIAFYSSCRVMDNLEGLVYVDMYDPDIDTDPNNETYIIVGFNYYPAKGLIISPNIRMTSFENGNDSETMFKMNFAFKF